MTNKTLLSMLKKRVEGAGKRWVEQLTIMIWAYRNTPKHSITLSPFHMAYGSEAVLPTKYMLPISWTRSVDNGLNEQLLSNEKALLDVKRSYDKQRISRLGDWVLKRAIKCSEQGKIDTNWNGSYVIDVIASKSAYFLHTIEGKHLSLPWNVVHHKFFRR